MIITPGESLPERLTATDGRILRDHVLFGFAVRANKRRRTFLIATSVNGRQVRIMLGLLLTELSTSARYGHE